jgi:hypothetical protein
MAAYFQLTSAVFPCKASAGWVNDFRKKYRNYTEAHDLQVLKKSLGLLNSFKDWQLQ